MKEFLVKKTSAFMLPLPICSSWLKTRHMIMFSSDPSESNKGNKSHRMKSINKLLAVISNLIRSVQRLSRFFQDENFLRYLSILLSLAHYPDLKLIEQWRRGCGPTAIWLEVRKEMIKNFTWVFPVRNSPNYMKNDQYQMNIRSSPNLPVQ